MTSRFYGIERQKLNREIEALLEPSKAPQADPILGNPPEIVFRWNTFAKKHGSLIEWVMSEVIQGSPGWRAASQTRFKCDTDSTKKLIDRIAINHSKGVVIFLECKRNLGNVSGPYLKTIRAYDSWCRQSAHQIAHELGMNPMDTLVRFAVLNAYGDVSDRERVAGIPVLMPIDLPLIFPRPVLEAFRKLNNMVYARVAEHPAFHDFLGAEDVPLHFHDQIDGISNDYSPEEFRQNVEKVLDRRTAS